MKPPWPVLEDDVLSLPFSVPLAVSAPFIAYYALAALVAVKDPKALRYLAALHPLRGWRGRERDRE